MATVNDIQTEPTPRRWTVIEYHRMRDAGILDGKSVELLNGVVTVKETGERFRWTVDDYFRIGEAGFLDRQRVQLVDGEILVMSPQGTAHAEAVERINELLVTKFSREFRIRCQLPLRLATGDEPEPDFAIIPRSWQFSPPHPSFAAWVVEVSDSTLDFDQHEKSGIYARSRIPEYWIVNLMDGQVEVRRNPISDATHVFGGRYVDIQCFRGADLVQPLAASEAIVSARLLQG